MLHQLQQIAFMGVFFVLPGLYGGYLAHSKGRNPLLWFLLNMCFPPTLMVTIFQKPLKAVPGHYRQCPKCKEYSKWRESICKYCQTDLMA
jgi:hypothetical protein